MSAGTEDDTYLALKRIPLAQLEEQRLGGLHGFCHTMVKTQVFENYVNDREYRRQEFYRKWLPFIGGTDSIYIHTSIRILDNLEQDTTAALFSGTGWTPADYVSELTKIYTDELQKLNARDKKWARIQGSSAVLSGLLSGTIIFAFSPPLWFSLPMALLIGVSTGLLGAYFKAKAYAKDL